MIEYQNRRRIRRSGLEKAIQIQIFDAYLVADDWQREAKTKALTYAADPVGWFFIGGAVGCGKTHLCTAICGELLMSRSVSYAPWREVIVPIKASANDDEARARLIEPLLRADALYIDDFFKGGATEADKRIAFEVLDYRYRNALSTIISTEYYLDTLMGIDAAIASRICEMARFYLVQIMDDGRKNYRLKGICQQPDQRTNVRANSVGDDFSAKTGENGAVHEWAGLYPAANAIQRIIPEKSDIVIYLPLNDKTQFPVTGGAVHEWAGLYPAVYVIQQITLMREWFDKNPKRRKGPSGILPFVHKWLSAANEKAVAANASGSTDGTSNIINLPPRA